MKKSIFLIIMLLIFTISISYIFLIKFNNSISKKNNKHDSKLVHVKAFINKDCNTCTKVDKYLEVYKKAGVKFETVNIKEYGSNEYKAHINEYNITKLPFIVFSKELSSYETIANSWNDTFGYKSENGDFIPTDIIPPYYDLKIKRIEGLIDITYIGDNLCKNCYTVDDTTNILSTFGLRFQNITQIDKKSQEARKFIKRYKIDTYPIVLLSKNTSLYTNFSYFWQTIGSIETDRVYVLRKPGKLGLNINN